MKRIITFILTFYITISQGQEILRYETLCLLKKYHTHVCDSVVDEVYYVGDLQFITKDYTFSGGLKYVYSGKYEIWPDNELGDGPWLQEMYDVVEELKEYERKSVERYEREKELYKQTKTYNLEDWEC